MPDNHDVGTPVDVTESWFDQWLESGTVAQRSVEIYGRPDLFARFESLDRQLAIEREVAEGEEAMSSSTVDDIEDEMRKLYEQWQASKTTWYIRALSEDEIESTKDECGFPDDLPENASDEARKAHEKATEEAQDQANYRLIAKALVKVEGPGGDVVKTDISPDEVEIMKGRLGTVQILRLAAAAMAATTQEVTIPVPLSRKNSKNDRS